MSLPIRREVQALVHIRPDCEWFALSLVPSHAYGSCRLCVRPPRCRWHHQVPRVSLPDLSVTLIRETCTASCEDITPRSSLLQTHASIPPALLSFGLRLVRGVSAGCYQPLLPAGPARRYLCESFPACLGPWNGGSPGVHLPVSSSTSSAFPRTLSRSASRVSPSKRFHDGSPFRDCSPFVMFRPSGLLASPIVPTAAAYRRRRAAEAFTSELNMLRCLRMHRICLPPAQAIGGGGTYTPLDSQPCRLLQCNRDFSIAILPRCRQPHDFH